MKKYEKIILMSDMDGTLLDSSSSVSEKNCQAINEFVAEGGHFGIATGRGQLNALAFLSNIAINTPCILYNGSALYDFTAGKFLELCELPEGKLEKYLRFCLSEFVDVMVHIYTSEMNYIVSPEVQADPVVTFLHHPHVFCRIEDIAGEPWIKVLLSGKKSDLEAMEKKIKDFGMEETVNWVFSSDIYLELLPPQVSKGSMLTKLRKIMGGSYRIYAVGDYNNDKEMLLEADVGVAVQNALPGVKDVADMITVSNNDSAIADIIYNLMVV